MKYIPYIYEPERSIQVFNETENYFTDNPDIIKRIRELGWIYHTVGMIIPQTKDNLWSGHFFPYIESWDDLQISFTQCCFGLYKQAFVSLRSGLELGLLSVYYNINDEGHKEVVDWYKSKDNREYDTPYAKDIWKILLSNKNIKLFNDKFDLRKTYDNLSFLHNYVHTKGYKFSNSLGMFKSNYQTFEPEVLNKWLECYAEVISLICTMHLLKYPIAVVPIDYQKKFGIDIPSFGGLEEYNIDRIATILPSGYLQEIRTIAMNDPTTLRTITEIISLPDITGDGLEEQNIHVEKILIKTGGGFKKWFTNQESFLTQMGQTDFDDSMKIRIQKLKKWAEENNLL